MLVTSLLAAFAAVATLLWLSIFGYLALLAAIATRRRAGSQAPVDLPAIALILPTFNEAARIDAKLADLARIDYPRDRLRIIVVDGRSSDGTLERVEAARQGGAPIEVLRASQAVSKLEQLRCGLEAVREEVVVATDADAELDPACVRLLVEVLVRDPHTAVAGARVRPATRLAEERIYWWFLNTLWWLEGEALSAAAVSGVCYAMRRRVVLEAPRAPGADDILFALAAGATGHGVRLCRPAWARETRVPQTVADFVRFRRRRGAGYFGALLAPLPASGLTGWRIARGVRLFHFRVTPATTAIVVVSGVALLWTPYWPWPLAAGAAFALPVFAALFASRSLADVCARRWQLAVRALSLVGLVWWSLLLTPRRAVADRVRDATAAAALSDAEEPS